MILQKLENKATAFVLLKNLEIKTLSKCLLVTIENIFKQKNSLNSAHFL